MAAEEVPPVDTTGVELEPLPDSDYTLVRIRDPLDALDEYKRIATRLNAELKAGDMITKIGQHEHVRNEGWQTLASMVGITAVITSSGPVENGWEARCEARTLDGRVVGAGEAMCTRSERNWARRDDYALRSMAQSRAQSKALKGPLGFVMTLAGHSPTPAEEMEADTAEPPQLPEWAQPGSTKAAAEALRVILHAAGVDDVGARWREIGQRTYDRFDKTVPAGVVAVLQDLAGTIAAHTPGLDSGGEEAS